MRLVGVGVFLAFVAALCVPSFANAPNKSLRPITRPSQAPVQRLSLVPVYYNATLRPVARPVSIGGTAPLPKTVAMTQVVSTTTVTLVTSRSAVTHSLRPIARPNAPKRTRTTQPRSPEVVTLVAMKAPQSIPTSKKGSICGDRNIRGQNMSAISGSLKGCGVKNPVRVTSVAGVPLSKAATMDCNTAKALNHWVEKGVKPTVGRLGGGAARIDVISGYSCRSRNNKRGAKISEHGKGKAVDISGVTLANGVSISVLKGWNSKAQGRLLRSMHQSACGPFGTVLGPSANKYHRDHFHFDTASYRSGAYCK